MSVSFVSVSLAAVGHVGHVGHCFLVAATFGHVLKKEAFFRFVGHVLVNVYAGFQRVPLQPAWNKAQTCGSNG